MTSVQPQFLAFNAQIGEIMYHAGLFKLQGCDLYWWTWLDCNDWFQSRIDIEQGKILPLDQYEEIHNSQHESGEFHVRYENEKAKKFSMGVQVRKPLMNLDAPIELPRSPVPLNKPFPWFMHKGPWNLAGAPIVLTAGHFGDGVYLHPYLCCKEHIDILSARFKNHWVAGNGYVKLLVVVESD